jgi:hypothetical protein
VNVDVAPRRGMQKSRQCLSTWYSFLLHPQKASLFYLSPDVCLDLLLSVGSWEEEEGALTGGVERGCGVEGCRAVLRWGMQKSSRLYLST